MKKVLLVTSSLIALGAAAPAIAADLAARPYTKAPADDRCFLRLERLLHRRQRRLGIEPQVLGLDGSAGVALAPEGCHDATGGTVGGQIGYRWQAGTWVFGLEAQGNWADLNGQQRPAWWFLGYRNSSKVEAFGLFTGQIGYAVNNVLLYVKGGAAVTTNTYRINNARPARRSASTGEKPAGVARSALASNTASLRTGRSASNTITCSCRIDDNFTHAGRCAVIGPIDIRQDVDLVTARINYRFGGPVDREVLSFRELQNQKAPGNARGFFVGAAIGRSLPRGSPAGKAVSRGAYLRHGKRPQMHIRAAAAHHRGRTARHPSGGKRHQ